MSSRPPEGVAITRVASWSAMRRQRDALDLVDQIAAGEPYHCQPGEVPPAEQWFPALVDCSTLTLMAYDAPGRPAGYCVALLSADHPDALAVADRLRLSPADTAYLAELGVSAALRRRGIASTLLARALDRRRWLVRTLERNAAAISLYQRHGFALVPGSAQVHRGRARVFLARPPGQQPARATDDHAYIKEVR